MAKRKPKPIDIPAALAADELLKPIADLQKRDGLTDREVKMLRGKILKDSLHDPISKAELDLVRDDRRYAKWLKALRSDKSGEL